MLCIISVLGVCVPVYLCACVFECVCMPVLCIRACVCVYMCLCLCVSVCVYLCVCLCLSTLYLCVLYMYCRYVFYLHSSENPNCLQTTTASSPDQKSSHTVPHVPLRHTSILPSSNVSPLTSLISPSLHSTQK